MSSMLRPTLLFLVAYVAFSHSIEFAGHGRLFPGMSVTNFDKGLRYTLVRQLDSGVEHKKYISSLKASGASNAERTRAEHHHAYALNLLEISNSLSESDSESEVTFHRSTGSEVTLAKRREVNRGSFGVIWLVQDEKTGIPYALKVFDAPIYEFFAQKKFTSREEFRAEMWAMEKGACDAIHDTSQDESISEPFLKGKESLLNYVDAFKSGSDYFILYPLYDGDFQALQDDPALGGGQPGDPAMSEEEMYTVVGKVLSGVAYLNKKNILHRDLKPANILYIREDGKVKDVVVADFGLYKESPNIKSSCGKTGTKSFLPPENFSKYCRQMKAPYSDTPTSKDALFAVDSWGVGVSLMAMISKNMDDSPLWASVDDWKKLRCQPRDSSCRSEWDSYEWMKARNIDALRRLHVPREPSCIHFINKYARAWWRTLLMNLSACVFAERISAIEGYTWILYEEALANFQLPKAPESSEHIDPMPNFKVEKKLLKKLWKYMLRLLVISRSLDHVRRAMSTATGEKLNLWKVEHRIVQLRTDIITIGMLRNSHKKLYVGDMEILNEAIERVKKAAEFFENRSRNFGNGNDNEYLRFMEPLVDQDRLSPADKAAVASLREGRLHGIVIDIFKSAHPDLRKTIEKLQTVAEQLRPVPIPLSEENLPKNEQRKPLSKTMESDDSFHTARSNLIDGSGTI